MTPAPPKRAIILAAGQGSRLRPITDTLPKPLVPVHGKAMIDHALDRLAAIGVEDVTVNTHHLAAQIRSHLAGRRVPRITLSQEDILLDTGGGIKKALAALPPEPVYVLSGDTLWQDGPSGNALLKLAAAWNDAEMDLLLLLQPLKAMKITHGTHDYNLDPGGKPVLVRNIAGDIPENEPYFWFGLRILHPRLFENTPDGPFSFLDLMIKAERAGRLAAVIHDGTCYHISRPEDLLTVNAMPEQDQL